MSSEGTWPGGGAPHSLRPEVGLGRERLEENMAAWSGHKKPNSHFKRGHAGDLMRAEMRGETFLGPAAPRLAQQHLEEKNPFPPKESGELLTPARQYGGEFV